MNRFEYAKQELANGKSQRQIARDLNVDHTTIKYWINNNFSTNPKNKELSEKDIQQICSLNSAHYSYMLGSYLGDGHILKQPRTYKLKLYCSTNHPEIISDQLLSLNKLFPNNIVSEYKQLTSNCIEVSVHSKNLPSFFPQHNLGKKHERDVSLTNWQWDIVNREPECFIKGLIDTDGSEYLHTNKGSNKSYRYYVFTNKSTDIIDTYLKIMHNLEIGTCLIHTNSKDEKIISNVYTRKKKYVDMIDKLYIIAESKIRNGLFA